MSDTRLTSLTSKWFIHPGREREALAALTALAAAVQAGEPETLGYLVHTPLRAEGLQPLPPSNPQEVLFFEIYASPAAFLAHVKGPIFLRFVAEHGSLFVAANGAPFVFVEFFERRAGFLRSATFPPAAGSHPAVFFEILAQDQPRLLAFYQAVFGWQYTSGTDAFAFIPFPHEATPLLGGIGQANPTVAGFEAGRNFYLRVEDLETTMAAVVAAGGSRHLEPTESDGYSFAMVKDPEGNVIGLIHPFPARGGPAEAT